mmetsp:Transcript_3534/g.9498  ORF Transcript_3534/g.9498 Transcript_3534/m.9498 type:complete len:211 (-) Transcript_3534:17-649(-)
MTEITISRCLLAAHLQRLGLAILHRDTEYQEDSVEEAHADAQLLVQPPPQKMDEDHDREDHEKQDEDVKRQVFGKERDLESGVTSPEALDETDLDHPGDGKADEDVEDVGADRGADGHVALASPGDRHGGRHVGDGRACGEDGEALDDRVDPERTQHDLAPPNQAECEAGNPEQGDPEAEHEELRGWSGNAVVEKYVHRAADEPEVAPLT